VIDVSNYMATIFKDKTGKLINRLEYIKNVLTRMLDEESTDNFNIYLYNESVIKFRKDLVQSNISNRT
jgi:hypothetical protein